MHRLAGPAMLVLLLVTSAGAQPMLPLPRFLCPPPATSCQPPPDKPIYSATCNNNPGLIGQCYWVRGIYSIEADRSAIETQNPKRTLWVEAPPDSRLHHPPAPLMPGIVEKAFGPNMESVSALYQVCPIPHAEPFGGKLPAVCIETAREIRTIPFSDEFYRKYPLARQHWQDFLKHRR